MLMKSFYCLVNLIFSFGAFYFSIFLRILINFFNLFLFLCRKTKNGRWSTVLSTMEQSPEHTHKCVRHTFGKWNVSWLYIGGGREIFESTQSCSLRVQSVFCGELIIFSYQELFFVGVVCFIETSTFLFKLMVASIP